MQLLIISSQVEIAIVVLIFKKSQMDLSKDRKSRSTKICINRSAYHSKRKSFHLQLKRLIKEQISYLIDFLI